MNNPDSVGKEQGFWYSYSSGLKAITLKTNNVSVHLFFAKVYAMYPRSTVRIVAVRPPNFVGPVLALMIALGKPVFRTTLLSILGRCRNCLDAEDGKRVRLSEKQSSFAKIANEIHPIDT